MKEEKLGSELGTSINRERLWMVAFFIALGANLLLAVNVATRKVEVQTTLLTPGMTQPFTLIDGEYSVPYVEQVSTWFLTMWLNYTPGNFERQMNTFLQHVDPEYFGRLQRVLLDEFDDIKRQRRSSLFFPQKVQINQLQAVVTGIRQVKIGSTEATRDQEHWHIKLSQRHDGLVTIADIQKISGVDAKRFKDIQS